MRSAVERAVDLGAADLALPAHHVTMVLQRPGMRQASLTQYLSDVQNPHSAAYHHWLTPAEYGSRFGAAAEDVQTITAWLESEGLTIEKTSPAANLITFSGSVGQLETAFSTSIRSISIGGQKHIANTTAPQIPRAFAAAVKTVVGLDDIHPRSNLQIGPAAKYNSLTRRIEPELTLFDSVGNPYLYVDPADAATIYDTPNANLNTSYKGRTYDGTGVTVGVVGDSNVDLTPVTNYRTAFLGETTATVNLPTVIVDGDDPGLNGDEVETWLDLEVLGGIAPKAKINYYTSADSDISAGLFNAMIRAVNDNAVSVLSISFGECEALAGTETTDFIGELFQQAAAQGITVTVSSGDAGSAACDNQNSETTAINGLGVNGLGSSPNNVSVGGTDYDVLGTAFSTYVETGSTGNPPYYATALSYIPEEPWNDSTSVNGNLADNQSLLSNGSTNIIGGGGGASSVFPKPAYQNALTPADNARDLPDVSLLAANGLYGAVWVLCETSAIYGPDCVTNNGAFTSSTRFDGAGGTSAATPAFAGMLALVVQATGSRLGNVNNVLYTLAANKYSTVFHDVTTGNNAVVCTSGTQNCGGNGFMTGYNAGTGYDQASGLGSVDAAAMLANWTSAVGASSTTGLTINGSTSPVTAVHGTTLNFGVNVTPSTATGAAGLVTTATAAAGAPTLNGQPATIAISDGTGNTGYNGLPGGVYTVYANYGGDTKTAASQSNAISVNISAEASSTQLSVNAYNLAGTPLASLNAIPYGSYIFADTSVYGTAEGYAGSQGFATGTMTNLDNGTIAGTSPITSGNYASFPPVGATVYPYAVGAHSVTATYPGDSSYKPNTSNAVSFTVVKGATSSALFPATAVLVSNTSDKIEVDITTSSLALAPTGTITLSANGVTLGTSSNLTSAESVQNGTSLSYAIFNVLGSHLANGVNTITATYSGDSNYSGSTGATTVTVTEAAISLQTEAIDVSAGSTTDNTAKVTVSSAGGFAGPVNLSCAVTSAPANAISPITCGIPASIDLSGTAPATATLTVNSSAGTTTGTYVVTISGKDAATGMVTASTTSTVVVTGTPAITLTNSGAITIARGATTGNSSALSVTPVDGFTGAVSFSCAVTTSPAAAKQPITCAVSPSLATISGATAATATLTISSTAGTPVTIGAIPLRAIGGTALAGMLFFLVPTVRRRQLRGFLSLIALIALGGMVACGGSSASSGTPPSTSTGTTAGAYVVTVTATPAGASAQTATVNVTVN
ncbi:putative periplasmic aspartyl protease [Acidisarcina polymorpha]|uniref:Putative periplasmic aspartyl protease n=1 Tax=Acidisarcina polymorpha TaxID=2211140 RepID=A0A2Z5G481_9BACT|nr:putative periplasmic aspartyl protease [Acidisarcina polymorpha]